MHFYNNLYSEQFIWWPNLDGLSFGSIDAVEANWLEKAFEEGEVFGVAKAMKGDKASGLDSYFMAFF